LTSLVKCEKDQEKAGGNNEKVSRVTAKRNNPGCSAKKPKEVAGAGEQEKVLHVASPPGPVLKLSEREDVV